MKHFFKLISTLFTFCLTHPKSHHLKKIQNQSYLSFEIISHYILITINFLYNKHIFIYVKIFSQTLSFVYSKPVYTCSIKELDKKLQKYLVVVFKTCRAHSLRNKLSKWSVMHWSVVIRVHIYNHNLLFV